MANLKEIKDRIASVESTQQTTAAMKMISASKLRKAQLVLQHLRSAGADMLSVPTLRQAQCKRSINNL